MTGGDALAGLAVGALSAGVHLGLLWLRARRALQQPALLVLTVPLSTAGTALPIAACALRGLPALLSAVLGFVVLQRLVLLRVRKGL